MSSATTPDDPGPIARVLPLINAGRLDRLFDYTIPEEWLEDAQPGCLVRVTFAGRRCNALIIERRHDTDVEVTLLPIRQVLSRPVLTETIWELCTVLAQRSASPRSAVLRHAIPPHQASAEKKGSFRDGAPWPQLAAANSDTAALTAAATEAVTAAAEGYEGSEELLRRLLPNLAEAETAAEAGEEQAAAPEAWGYSWLTAPGDDPEQIAAQLASAMALQGAGSTLILVANQRALDRVADYLTQWLSAAQITVMSSAVGPGARYRRFLSILEGQARVVVGTKSACLMPMVDFALAIVLDEHATGHVFERSAYLHAREVMMERCQREQVCGLLLGYSRSADTQLRVEEGQIRSIRPTPAYLTRRRPWIRAFNDTERERTEVHVGHARMSGLSFHAIRRALEDDRPVLVSVPRRGFAPSVACRSCRESARCRHCHGPLEVPSSVPARADINQVPLQCRWCGARETSFRCGHCGGQSVRLSIVGHQRTAAELGRAFPSTPTVTSAGGAVRPTVPHSARIVVATPGAEPRVAGGHYGAVIIVDPWITLGSADLRAGEQAIAQWMEAAALAYPKDEGGMVVIGTDAHIPTVHHVIAWSAEDAAAEELASRRETQLPPYTVVAAVDGSATSVGELRELWSLPEGTTVLGPVPLPPGVRLPTGMPERFAHRARRLLLRTPREAAMELGGALKEALAIRHTRGARSVRSSSPEAEADAALRVVMDPVRIG